MVIKSEVSGHVSLIIIFYSGGVGFESNYWQQCKLSENSTGLGLDKVSAGTPVSMMMMIIVIPCVLGRINEPYNIRGFQGKKS